ncbi:MULTISPECIES: PaaI family thioesterase [Sphingomonas]|uniref:PaaI family thioesterase n=1 Tax=Sphingomonas TaxID=13687 RepID=UPI000926BAC0|nr:MULTISPECIES: PaaI family thioesterase [Sphingomonas]MCW6531056.1 PaaI family thioesterase [Sphingomonas lycopersici]OJU16268.1 MAG: phenylacetic acid degradation protein [Sphingomonas sp. 66-10]
MKLPPYTGLLKATLELAEDGTPVMVMPFHDDVLGRPGFLQGGAISGLLEVAAIAALRHALENEGGGRIKPINVTVDFMRGGRGLETRAAGRITRLGNRVANVDAFAWQDDRSRPIAAARMNYLIERD